jgi:hypothetical protein
MKLQIRKRDRRALLGLGVAVAVYVFISSVILPGLDRLQSASQDAADKEQELVKYRRATTRKGRYTQLLAQARKNVSEAEAGLVRGDNASLASVELQNIIEEAAKKLDIQLSQRNVSTARKKDQFFNEITMTLSFDCTPNQLAMFLGEIRNAPKFVVVRNAQVAPVQMVQQAPQDGDLRQEKNG